jgi:hypothetical protein
MLASVSRGACNRGSCGSLRAAVAVGHVHRKIEMLHNDDVGDFLDDLGDARRSVDNTDPQTLRRLIEQQEL